MTDWKDGNDWSFEKPQEQNQSNRHPRKDNNEPVHFKVVEHIATLSTTEKGWRKELNKVSWNNTVPRYDIRSWKDDYSRVGKGVTLFEDEMIVLGNVLQQLSLTEDRKEE